MNKPYAKIKNDLFILLAIITTLIIIGFIFVYSSSSIYALEKFKSPHYFIKKQFLGLFIGSLGLISATLIPLKIIKKLSPFILLITFFMTALTKLPLFALKIHGSSRWLNIFGFSFQPSEALKFALIVYVAYFLEKRKNILNSFSRTYLPLLFILLVTSILLLLQPDFGMTVTVFSTCFILFFIAQLKSKHLLTTFYMIIPAGIALILFKPYRLKRILTFLNPWADPQGSGFQIIQSLIAIGSGGLWGVGISHSKQKFFYLPMQHTDFIFSIIAEETGFVGSTFLIILFCSFLYFGLALSLQFTNLFDSIATSGFIIIVSLQATMNLAVATGLAPTKGVGLPFISYGNSSLICNLIMTGLIINIAQKNRKRV